MPCEKNGPHGVGYGSGVEGVGGGVKFAKADYMARAFAIEFLADCAFGGAKFPPPRV